jgi:hypothetical protein
MAAGDIKILSNNGVQTVPTLRFQTEAGATAILFGEPMKMKAAGSPYVIPMATAEPVIGTTSDSVGIAASDSTQTAAADGVVTAWVPMDGIVYIAAAHTLVNVDTQAEYDALVGDRVDFDLTTGVYTVNEDAGDSATSALRIVDLDIVEHPGMIAFTYRGSATFLN